MKLLCPYNLKYTIKTKIIQNLIKIKRDKIMLNKITKKLLTILFVAVIIFLINMKLIASDTRTQDVKVLPQTAQNFINKHFSNEKIAYIEVDKEFFGTDYEVNFESGIEIEFAKDGSWKSIDCNRTAVPIDIIPAKILDYVKQNYKNLIITDIEKKSKKYDVELSNNIDLEFNSEGNFIRIDD